MSVSRLVADPELVSQADYLRRVGLHDDATSWTRASAA
jgi:hypothetical protein